MCAIKGFTLQIAADSVFGKGIVMYLKCGVECESDVAVVHEENGNGVRLV